MAGARDAAFAAAVAAAVEVRTSDRPPVEPLSIYPLSALHRLSELELVISMRLHGVILAALAGTPCVPLVYDLKVGAIAEQLNLGDVAVPVKTAGWRQFEQSISTVLTKDRQDAVAERVETIRRQLVAVRVLAESAFR
jgi:polysaccharide pyruvyl transferase WcaK-like protein